MPALPCCDLPVERSRLFVKQRSIARNDYSAEEWSLFVLGNLICYTLALM